MLHEVDQSITNLLFAELQASSQGLVADPSQIVVGGPSGSENADIEKPKIRLFLHDVHENLAVRDQSFEIRRSSDQMEVGKGRKPTRLNLSYILTVEAKSPSDEHMLLGAVLGILMRNGFVPAKYLTGTLVEYGEQAVTLSVGQRDHWAHADAPRVWQAIGSPLRPFVGIVASAMFDPYETKTVKLVREAIFALGQGTHPDGADRQMKVHSVRVSAAGVVSGPNGEAAPDVKVEILTRSESTLTDEQGVFLFRNLPPGPHTLAFTKRGFEDAEVEVIAPVRGLANEMQPVAIQLKPASPKQIAAAERGRLVPDAGAQILTGTLRYGDGRPAAFVPVRVGDKSAVTDSNGVYHLTGVGKAAKTIVAEIAGRGDLSAPIDSDNGVAELPKK